MDMNEVILVKISSHTLILNNSVHFSIVQGV
jgi:hypothetical protein